MRVDPEDLAAAIAASGCEANLAVRDARTLSERAASARLACASTGARPEPARARPTPAPGQGR